MSRPSARAAPLPPILEPQHPEPERVLQHGIIFAFAVIQTKGGFTPTRFTLDGIQVVEVLELHEAVNSMALAYEYLQGDVAMHYGRTQR